MANCPAQAKSRSYLTLHTQLYFSDIPIPILGDFYTIHIDTIYLVTVNPSRLYVGLDLSPC